MADIIDYKKTAQFFKALAHPTRIMIVETLLEGEKCVLVIQDLIQASQPNVSQHLNILKNSEIVDFQQKGNMRCYFLLEPDKVRTLIRSLK
jgi:DNA-binding transcriptional ArsR family regulator